MRRRNFLITSGAALTTAALGVWGAFELKRPRVAAVRYFVPSPEGNDLLPQAPLQDFSMHRSAPVRRIEGFTPPERTLMTLVGSSGEARRAFVPGLLHAGVFHNGRILTVTRGAPSILYAIDPDTLDVLSWRRPPEGFLFGGHLTKMDESTFALTLNSRDEGRYDSVGFFDGESLKETGRSSSHGFQAHDLKLSADGTQLSVGHYGSHFHSGPYGLGEGGRSGGVYPGTVTTIDPRSGRLLGRVSSELNGPQGHLAVASDGRIFLTKNPPLLVSRGDEGSHPAYAEGQRDDDYRGLFENKTMVTGTTIELDGVTGEFLLPAISLKKVLRGKLAVPDNVGAVDLAAFGDYGAPFGLCFHPDERHYLVSCERGFMAFERGSHRFHPALSSFVDLGTHSHFAIG